LRNVKNWTQGHKGSTSHFPFLRYETKREFANQGAGPAVSKTGAGQPRGPLDRNNMKSKNLTVLGPMLISYLLGCITFYFFLCFTGVVLAFFIDKGINSFIFHNFIKPLPQGNLRQYIFAAYINLIPIVVNVVVVFLFTFFSAKYLAKKLLINSVVLTLGAITVDLYYFRNMPFESSFFFSESHSIDFSNLTIWFICTIISIKLAYLLTVMRVSRNVQHGLGP
jgi:fatty-acid desaturase